MQFVHPRRALLLCSFNVKGNFPNEVADILHIQVLLGWNVYLLNTPPTKVIVNAVIKVPPFAWVSHSTFLPKNQSMIPEAISVFSQLMGITDAMKIRVVHRDWGKQSGIEGLGQCSEKTLNCN